MLDTFNCEKNCAITKCIRGECECHNEHYKKIPESKEMKEVRLAAKEMIKILNSK